jgi:hypothetical protein
VAFPQPKPPITFRPTGGQRTERLLVGIVCLLAGLGILVFHGRAGADSAGLIVAGIALTALGLVFLAARRAETLIDAAGVRTWSMFGRHSCAWTEVTDVELRIDANDGPPMVYRIKIHCRGGSFTLPAPTDSQRKDRHANPEFTNQLAIIRSYWEAATHPAS